jgi:hypothetical protein
VLGERYPVAIALHTDHAPRDRAEPFLRPLIEESRRRVMAGEEPLFQSHMFDGSTLPLEQNLAISSRLLDELAPLGVVLELESGIVGGEEDGVAGPESGRDELYTTTGDLLRVADCSAPGSAAGTCSPRRSAMSTASTRRARCGCAPRCCGRARRRSPPHTRALASNTSSTAAAALSPTKCARRSPTAS